MVLQITSGSLDSVAASFEEEERVPFDDIILSGLLGKGSYGNVYFGVWQKSNEWQMDVAVKVRKHVDATFETLCLICGTACLGVQCWSYVPMSAVCLYAELQHMRCS